MRRRDFVKQLGAASVCSLAGKAHANNAGPIAILTDASDERVTGAQGIWAVNELRSAIERRDVPVIVSSSLASVSSASLYIGLGERHFEKAGGTFEQQPFANERHAFKLQNAQLAGRPAVLVAGADPQGFVYGVLELADRVRYGEPVTAFQVRQTETQQSANHVRSIARAFVSEVEDKEWYYDKNFWRSYLSELALSRFSRFSLTFGLGYDFPRNVVGDYFHFPYPYLFDVPGYNVRVVPLSNSERDKNLETLKFITEETARRGLECQIGLWTHAYKWVDSPNAHHEVQGLTPETHAPYCRDALALLLKECPAIQGLTLRVHGESGIPEGSYDFWRTLFEGITKSGRKIEIDMHAKGLDATMIKVATDTGMPVKISPKFWAEHMGLSYHQADIRSVEIPHAHADTQGGIFKLSSGSRSFLRYGYGDLFRRDRPYEVLFRIWPGTQRVLLWGDPKTAAGYGHASHFCGAAGVEIFEPLFFKGRQGSGLPGGRCAYGDKSLKPADGDFSKFRYSYRVWGHNLYNPESDPAGWRRYLQNAFGSAGPAMEQAFSNCSRVLPLLTTAHLPSASNNSFWPEIYTNMPIVEGSEREPYSDTPAPKRFGTVSPLDPELFLTIEQHANELLEGQCTGKYSPVEVAQWLENFAEAANGSLESARQKVGRRSNADFRRFDEDARIQIGLGQFFAAKLRSGVLYEIYLQTGDPAALQQAIASYKKARDAWSSMAQRAKNVYRPDITYGPQPMKRGHWMDRLPAIDTDLAAMESSPEKRAGAKTYSGDRVQAAVKASLTSPHRPSIRCNHVPPKSFHPGEPVTLTIDFASAQAESSFSAVRLHYRHVNHAERWKAVDMDHEQNGHTAMIPGDYSNSSYPLQYYFELRRSPEVAWLYPGFNADLTNQPYFVIQAS